jgi:hypothetical protein
MTPGPKPLFLLADSSLLYWREGGTLFLDRLRALTGPGPVQAAYLGASNGDEPAFFDIFTGAMAGVGITACRMIPSRPTAEDRDWLARAHIILLAGGDPLLGWRTFQENGLAHVLRERYFGGAVLMGISAGAMHLAAQAWSESEPGLFPTLGLAPFLVGVHEPADWPSLKSAVRAAGPETLGIGIPWGGGALLHPDGTLEAVRHPLVQLRNEGGTPRELRLLLPPAALP